MALILSTSFQKSRRYKPKPKGNYFASKEYGLIRHRKRLEKKQLIETDIELKNLFDWIFLILKRFGFYVNEGGKKLCATKDDIAVGKLLGISAIMVKKYRIRAGYIPTQRIINKIKELEIISNKASIKVKEKKKN